MMPIATCSATMIPPATRNPRLSRLSMRRSAPRLALLPVIAPCKARADHRVGNILAAHPHSPHAAAVAVGLLAADPQRPAAQQLRQSLRRGRAERSFLRAARGMRFRSVEA